MTDDDAGHAARNRALWDRWAADFTPEGERAWAQELPTWGIWGAPEATVGMLPGNLAGCDAIELGCGTGYVSAWLARRGARVVAIDNSARQLATARRLQREHRVGFALVQSMAEAVPLGDASVDFAVSEYGACLWADPYRWVPEAARVLRPGGRLHFLVNSFLLMLCMPEEDGVAAAESLLRPAFGMYRIEWPGDHGVEFHLSHGDWIRLLGRNGLQVEGLIELRPPADATTRYPFVSPAWARQWPCEEVWLARKRG